MAKSTNSPASVISFTKTPQAKDDQLRFSEDRGTSLFDVMANDAGGNGKSLYSLSATDAVSSLALRNNSAYTAAGNLVEFVNGQVKFTALQDYNGLREGVTTTDNFYYAIQLGNGTISIASATVTITGTNDAPVAAAGTNAVNEDSTVSGQLIATDADLGDTLTFTTADSADGFALNADGSYTLDASGSVYQALRAGETRDIVIQYTVTDDAPITPLSDTNTLTIKVTGVNDAATIEAAADGDYDVTEAGDNTAGDSSASGRLVVTDVDTDEAVFAAVNSDALNGTYGTFTFDSTTGDWTYTLDQAKAEALNTGDNPTETLTVTSLDGTATHTIVVNVTGTNDTPPPLVEPPSEPTNGTNTGGTNTGGTNTGTTTPSDPNGDARLYQVNMREATQFYNFDGNDLLRYNPQQLTLASQSAIDTDNNGSTDAYLVKFTYMSGGAHPTQEFIDVTLLGVTGITTDQLVTNN